MSDWIIWIIGFGIQAVIAYILWSLPYAVSSMAALLWILEKPHLLAGLAGVARRNKIIGFHLVNTALTCGLHELTSQLWLYYSDEPLFFGLPVVINFAVTALQGRVWLVAGEWWRTLFLFVFFLIYAYFAGFTFFMVIALISRNHAEVELGPGPGQTCFFIASGLACSWYALRILAYFLFTATASDTIVALRG